MFNAASGQETLDELSSMSGSVVGVQLSVTGSPCQATCQAFSVAQHHTDGAKHPGNILYLESVLVERIPYAQSVDIEPVPILSEHPS